MKPILKWAGGKTQLLTEIKSLMPEEFGTYYEPFFGSGALFFDGDFEKAVINDTNFELYSLYQNLKESPEELAKEVDSLVKEFNTSPDKKAFYYAKRDEFNSLMESSEIRASALLIFINKSCFNGLYRTNSEGKYNVPFSQKKRLNSLSGGIMEASKKLKKTMIMNADFAEVVKKAKAGDFVYFDPPYFNAFTSYQAEGFGLEDQKRLALLFKKLTDRGVYCMLSNSNEELIKGLYGGYNIRIVEVKRNINRNGDGRKGEEVLITNYD